MEACASAHHWGRTLIPQGIINVAKRVPEILEDASNELPVPFRHLIDRLTEHLKELDRQVKQFEKEIIVWHRSSDLSRKLEKIPVSCLSGSRS